MLLKQNKKGDGIYVIDDKEGEITSKSGQRQDLQVLVG